MADAPGQSQPLPFLSMALVRAWENRTGGSIDLAAYRAGGGIAGAIEAAAERCYSRMTDAEQRGTRRLLVRSRTSMGRSGRAERDRFPRTR